MNNIHVFKIKEHIASKHFQKILFKICTQIKGKYLEIIAYHITLICVFQTCERVFYRCLLGDALSGRARVASPCGLRNM